MLNIVTFMLKVLFIDGPLNPNYNNYVLIMNQSELGPRCDTCVIISFVCSRILLLFLQLLQLPSLLRCVLLYYYRLRRSMLTSIMNPIVLDANIFLLMT